MSPVLYRAVDQLAFVFSVALWRPFWADAFDGRWSVAFFLVTLVFAVPFVALSTWACSRRDRIVRGAA